MQVAEVKAKLNAVSPSFCLAKWTTITLHLESGTAHSCHHPKVHEIPMSELKDNPAALHNTNYKIEQRKKMIEGERPSECGYCWNIEDLKTNEVSDRFIKSSAPYSMMELTQIVNGPYSKKIKPKYVEVSFSNACQFKCSYCSANFSSMWEEELEKFGNYPTRSGIKLNKIYREEDNPYVKAFWDWWPELKTTLHTFRITGGEPLLSPSTFKVMENLIENPEPGMHLAINSNLGAPPVLVDKLIKHADQLLAQNCVARFEIYTSIDAYGPRAEYIRNGLKHEVFWSNVEKLLSANERLSIVIMSTFNALSITSYIALLEKVLEINLKYQNEKRVVPLDIDISYLRDPLHQTVQVLPEIYISEMERIVNFIQQNQKNDVTGKKGFHDLPLLKSKRILEWMKEGCSADFKVETQKNFYRFFTEHDRRRNTDFLKTFPEMDSFWNHCKNLVDSEIPASAGEAQQLEEPAGAEEQRKKENHIAETLNSVSASFCAAKWESAVVNLESGKSASCQIPAPHAISESEVAANPAALHNTSYKLEQRKLMLAGSRPQECSQCWLAEDKNQTSNRNRQAVTESNDWSETSFKNLLENPLSDKQKLKYFEVSFSNECNFKCSYCTANLSTAWEEELEKFGNYPAFSGAKNTKTFKEDANSYVSAFWEWWPELKKDLRTFRINGGEPLLAKSTFRVMKDLLDNPEPELQLLINSNLGVQPEIMHRFLDLASQLTAQKSIKGLEVHTSIDAYGVRAEYIRNGLVHDEFWNNVEKVLAVSESTRVNIMCTFNALSVTSMIELLKKIIEVNARYTNPSRYVPIFLGMSLLEHPEYISIQILPEDYLAEMEKIVTFISDNQWHKAPNHVGFHSNQLSKANEILERMKVPVPAEIKKVHQKNFYTFFSEHDRRRSTNFVKAFPEMETLWNFCKSLVEQEAEARLAAEKIALDEANRKALREQENLRDIDNTREKLNKVGKGFCLAKWTTVTLHLESGTTHSCHHPAVHEVPVGEIKANPAAIHNSTYKIKQRKKMIEGGRPSECDYCWNIEDLGTGEVSDRILKSSEDWSRPDFDEVIRNPYSTKFKPKYVEVSFSSACQFKCSYCSADYSSTWEEELKKFGNYKNNVGKKTFKSYVEEENPHVKAFWEWWPELKNGLHTFRITGGEPLLSPSTFKVMESLIQQPEPNLSLAVNSNLGAPAVLMEKFVTLTDKMISGNAVKKFEIFTSIDAFGKRADYIRNGLKHEIFWSNVEKVLSCNKDSRINIMCTFNALSITSYIDLLKKIMACNLKFRNESRKLPIYLDISYLRYPKHQTVQVLPEEYVSEMEKIVDFISDNQWHKTQDHVGFHEDQLIKSKRILEWMRQGVSSRERSGLQKDFYTFFAEHDRRRQTNFLETFPEMENFWNTCKSQ